MRNSQVMEQAECTQNSGGRYKFQSQVYGHCGSSDYAQLAFARGRSLEHHCKDVALSCQSRKKCSWVSVSTMWTSALSAHPHRIVQSIQGIGELFLGVHNPEINIFQSCSCLLIRFISSVTQFRPDIEGQLYGKAAPLYTLVSPTASKRRRLHFASTLKLALNKYYSQKEHEVCTDLGARQSLSQALISLMSSRDA